MEEAETTLEQDLEALGVDDEIEPESAPEEEETAEQVESPEPEAEEQAEEQTESKESRDKRIAGYYAERARAEQLQAELEQLKQAQNQAQQTAAPAPDYDDFDTDAEYFAALAEFKADQKIDAFRQEQAQSRLYESQATKQQEFAKKVAKANIPGYDEKANRLVETVGVRPDTLQALYDMEGDSGPRIVAYLADHLDVADGITPFELGRLAAKISAPKPVQQTKAPPVVKPVKGVSSTGKSLDDPDAEFSFEEIEAIVNSMPD